MSEHKQPGTFAAVQGRDGLWRVSLLGPFGNEKAAAEKAKRMNRRARLVKWLVR